MNVQTTVSDKAINIAGVAKRFGQGKSEFTALKQISLQIQDNEFFTLLGPSGCGKTTLLRILAGFEAVSEGHVEIFGKDVVGLPANKRPVNTVFQHYALFPHMTVAENVAYGLRRLGKPEAEIQATVQRSLELVKMEKFAQRKPAQLSGGQQQRVALARALAPHPKVLLLDESLSALDLKLRQAMRAELKQLQKATGITFVFVTHDQEEALSMSDRIAVMSDGEIQQVGTPNEIYEFPVNRFVAAFIGEANFLETTIVGMNGAIARCRTDKGLELDATCPAQHQPGDRVTLFLRPEKVRIRAADADGIMGTVTSVEYLGQATSYHVDIGAADPILVETRNSDLGAFDHKLGDRVSIEFGAAALRVLAK